MKKLLIIVVAFAFVGAFTMGADAHKSNYPLILAHGFGGFDALAGYYYFGQDTTGIWVLDQCDGDWPMCNDILDEDMISMAGQTNPVDDSVDRGNELANDIQNWWVSRGWKDYDHPKSWRSSYVNIMGHSQGGLDLRVAAKHLYVEAISIPYTHRWDETWCYTNGVWPADWTDCRTSQNYATWYNNRAANTKKVTAAISLSSPHRGTAVIQSVIDNNLIDTFLPELIDFFYWVTGVNSGLGITDAQGACDAMKPANIIAFNNTYPSSTYAYAYASFITAQNGIDVNPALPFLNLITGCDDINGKGGDYTLCNGNPGVLDDDGLVGVNSQQMGYRLSYVNEPSAVTLLSDYGNVTNPNTVTTTQRDGMGGVIVQDHADVVSAPPDCFSEFNFYGRVAEFIRTYWGW